MVRAFHCAVGKIRALGKKEYVGKKGKLNSLGSWPSQSRVYEWERTRTESRTKQWFTSDTLPSSLFIPPSMPPASRLAPRRGSCHLSRDETPAPYTYPCCVSNKKLYKKLFANEMITLMQYTLYYMYYV